MIPSVGQEREEEVASRRACRLARCRGVLRLRGRRPGGPFGTLRPVFSRGRVSLAVCTTLLTAACAPPHGEPIDFDYLFGEPGLNPGQLAMPRAIELVETEEGEIDVLVVDRSGRIQRLDPNTGDAWASFPLPEVAIGKPVGLGIGPHPFDADRLCLWVADTHYHRVLVYDLPPRSLGRVEEYEPVLSFGSYGKGDGEFVYTTDVAVLTDDAGRVSRVFVGEYGGNDRISIFEPDAQRGEMVFAGSFGRFGTAKPGYAAASPNPDASDGSQIASPPAFDGEVVFNRPQSVMIDARGERLLVADACNHRIGLFSFDGELLGWVGGPDSISDEPGHVVYPYGVWPVEGGRFLVAEYGNSRVQMLNAAGEGLGAWGRAGRYPGEVLTPWSVAVAGRTAFVLDSGNDRVVGFSVPARSTATLWQEPPPTEAAAAGQSTGDRVLASEGEGR